MSLPAYTRSVKPLYTFSPFAPLPSPKEEPDTPVNGPRTAPAYIPNHTPSPASPELPTPPTNPRCSVLPQGWQGGNVGVVGDRDGSDRVSAIWQRSMSTPRLSSLLSGLGERPDTRNGRAAVSLLDDSLDISELLG